MKIEYRLIVTSEYHIGTGLEHPGVVDRTLVVQADGRLIIPAEHFRGVVRDACTRILYWIGEHDDCCQTSLEKGPRTSDRGVPALCGLNFRLGQTPCILCRLFGTTFLPKRYYFHDAVSQSTETRRSVHNRVDPAIGRVPEETFFSFEVGAPTTFRGVIETPQETPPRDEIGLLLAGLRLVERVGSRSGRGWGACRVVIEKPEDIDERLKAYLEEETRKGAAT